MDYSSFRSVIAMLGVLSMFVALVTNYWRFGNIDLTGRFANMRGVYARSVLTGVVLAALLRANIIDILQNPQGPALMFGWFGVPWGDYATPLEKTIGIFEEVFGIIVTGVVLAFLSKWWNDLFDIIYEFKRWVRGKANQAKPDDGARAPVTQATSPRPQRTRGGRGGRGRRGPSSEGSGGSGGSGGPGGPGGGGDGRRMMGGGDGGRRMHQGRERQT